jgi:hypothetical protein
MPKHNLLRTGLAVALIFGSLASTATPSFAASTSPSAGNQSARGGPTGGGSNPSGGGGGSGAGMPDALIIIRGNCPPGVAAIGCRQQPRPHFYRAKAADPQRCSNRWSLVELADGTIAEDRSEPMRKNCRVIRTFD